MLLKRKINADVLEDRCSGLGGSDAAIVLGVSPFRTRESLWREKVTKVIEEADSPAIQRGLHLEEMVANLYQEVKKRPLEIIKQKFVHPKFPFLFGHIDRKIQDRGDGCGPGVWECKCPGISYFRKCAREGPQMYYIVQLQHYLMVTGFKWGTFALFNAEEWKLIEWDVPRDEELINIIKEKCVEFWQYVIDRVEPPPLPVSVQLKMEDVKPGEIVNMEKVDPTLWEQLVKQYQTVKIEKDDANARLEFLEKAITEEMEKAGAEVAEGAGARIYYREHDGKKSLDKKAFLKGNPMAYEVYESYVKAGKPFKSFRAYFPKPIFNE